MYTKSPVTVLYMQYRKTSGKSPMCVAGISNPQTRAGVFTHELTVAENHVRKNVIINIIYSCNHQDHLFIFVIPIH